jgi:hypothetical protein
MPMDPRQAEVWAAYGWLIGVGQGIESLIRTIISAGDDPLATTPGEFEDVMGRLLDREKATLGLLIGKLESMGADAALITSLRDDVLADRNVLVHRYMIDRSAEIASPEGRAAMLSELAAVAPVFEESMRRLGEVIRAHLATLGKEPTDIEEATLRLTIQARDRLRTAQLSDAGPSSE